MTPGLGNVKVISSPDLAVQPPGRGADSEGQFHVVRNAVVRVCARQGTVGPIGEVGPDGRDGLPPAIEESDFYVVDDHYDDERRIYVEPKVDAVSAAWLLELAQALREHRGWDAVVSLGEGLAASVTGDAIRISGWASQAEDLPTILGEIHRYVRDRIGAKDERKAQRRALVRQLVPNAWDEASSLSLVAFFRTTSDGTAGDSVWLIHHGDRSILDLDQYDFQPDAVRPSVYWVRRSGELLDYVPGSRPSGSDLALLAEWALVTKGKPATRLDVRKGTRAWQFNLRSH
jgi:hypothetical protein